MSILACILEQKKVEVAALDRRALREAAEAGPPRRDFMAAIVDHRDGSRPALIAELKRASPSKGMLAPHLDLCDVAEIYADNGAAVISVLTDEKFFLGSLDTLRDLRFKKNLGLPLLRKDFIIDEAQLYEARACGADAVLLIAAALTDEALFADLHALALALGLTALVEVHNRRETERALRLKDVRLIGINNRDLDTFKVNLATSETLRLAIPGEISVVAESGIFTARDVARLSAARVDAILVGEALVTAADIPAKVRELAGVGMKEVEVEPS